MAVDENDAPPESMTGLPDMRRRAARDAPRLRSGRPAKPKRDGSLVEDEDEKRKENGKILPA
jgi:hypothetical protein